ncbi:amidohydrolase family protein [Clostridium polynesiense]|uniref:amidohydrolase family protein n=1 Tax=Clostridium polynesiense TaxID=1325933 RepID=UPI0005907DBD|nr:amidohydrolase family protein [Clostridium polynesiense]
MVIDYHCHLPWDREKDEYLVEQLIADMDKNNIDIRMISAIDGYSIKEQNDAMISAVKKYPDKLIGCAVINPKERDCIEELHRVIESGCIKAIELDSLVHNYYPETEPLIDNILDIAEKHNLLVNVFTGWGPRTMPAQWAFYAERHPGIKMVLLHMGTTDFGYGCVELVPQHDNLYVETSCMYEFPILRKAFANIDHSKFIFGTHYPHKITKCSLETFDLLNLSQEFRQQLFSDNAKEILGI